MLEPEKIIINSYGGKVYVEENREVDAVVRCELLDMFEVELPSVFVHDWRLENTQVCEEIFHKNISLTLRVQSPDQL